MGLGCKLCDLRNCLHLLSPSFFIYIMGMLKYLGLWGRYDEITHTQLSGCSLLTLLRTSRLSVSQPAEASFYNAVLISLCPD